MKKGKAEEVVDREADAMTSTVEAGWGNRGGGDRKTISKKGKLGSIGGETGGETMRGFAGGQQRSASEITGVEKRSESVLIRIHASVEFTSHTLRKGKANFNCETVGTRARAMLKIGIHDLA